MSEYELLKNLVLAPWILRATALIGVRRHVGGNQFRHAMSTLAILLDYKYFHEPALLKAAVIHDLFEDLPNTRPDDLMGIDSDAPRVIDLVMEVTRSRQVPKTDYLEHLLSRGSRLAKILKVADRISNLTDLNRGIYSFRKMKSYLLESEQFVLPMALEVDLNMHRELSDLIAIRRRQMNYLKLPRHLFSFLHLL